MLKGGLENSQEGVKMGFQGCTGPTPFFRDQVPPGDLQTI